MLRYIYKRTVGLLSLVLALQTCTPAFAALQEPTGNFTQWLRVGSSGAPASTLALDIVSTTKGVIFPRMTNTQRNAISSPTTGTIIFSTTDNSYEFYDGATWSPMGGIAALTANRAVVTNGAGALIAATTTDTEIGYVNGVTSAIQTQLNLKSPIASPTFTGVVTAPSFVGALTGNASTVTTNANLTGPITSVGNATTITASSVTSAMLAGSIAVNKLVALGTGIIPFTDGSGFLTTTNGPVYTSATQLETTTGDTTGNVMQSTTDTTSSASVRIDQSSKSLILQTLESSTNQGYGVQINTANIAGANANPTGALSFNTGNKTAGTGNSGGMTFTTGTTVGGSRGRIAFADGSENNAPGAVWTISGNAGGGHWVNPSDAKNYIANPDANIQSSSTTPAGWANYFDAAGTAPVDCTGGAPVTALTRNTTTPIGPTTDFRWTKSATSRQGEGFSYDFSIDSTDQAKVMKVNFDYSVASGTFVAGTPSADSDMTVWIYDITNAQLIQPSTWKLFSSTTSPPAGFDTTFQTNSNSTSYRLCVHTGTTSASAYTLAFRNFEAKRAKYTYGTPVTDWVPYTPTFTGYGTTTAVTFYSRRVGDSLEVRGTFLAGTTTAVPNKISIGYNGVSGNVVVDTAKSGTSQLVGMAGGSPSSTTLFGFGVLSPSSNDSTVSMSVQTSALSITAPPNASVVASTGQGFQLKFSVPIVGWASTVQMSDGAPQSEVSAKVYLTTAVTGLTVNSPLKYDTILWDKTGSYSTSTGLYTCPVPGNYQLAITAFPTAGAPQGIQINKNGSVDHVIGSMGAVSNVFSYATSINCNSGETIAVAPQGTVTFGASTSTQKFNSLSITRIGAPTTIGQLDSQGGSWLSTDTTALTTNVFHTMTMGTTIKDYNGTMSGGVWTAQNPGTYTVCGQINAVPSVAAQLVDNFISAGSFSFATRGTNVSAGAIVSVPTCLTAPMTAGQTAFMQIRCTFGSGTCASSTALGNSGALSIVRVGN